MDNSMINMREQFTEEATKDAGVLKVQIHEAKGIHNICIYDKQDVFAKLSLTHGKGDPVCTNVVSKGGKDPVFNENFELAVTAADSVLKCEMWMSSRAHSYLEDQLLGFVLVPLLSLTPGEEGKALEYGLSSTELFHSPAGIVRLTLALYLHEEEQQLLVNANGPVKNSRQKTACPFIKVFEDGLSSPESNDDHEYNGVDFPDIQAACEDQKLVSDFLQKGAADDINGIVTGPHFLFQTQNNKINLNSANSPASSSTSSDLGSSSDEQHEVDKINHNTAQDSASCLVIQQQQIVDLYVKSMQQFTEALAKMQLPVDLEASKKNKHQQQQQQSDKNVGSKSHRVFYGSRAFF